MSMVCIIGKIFLFTKGMNIKYSGDIESLDRNQNGILSSFTTKQMWLSCMKVVLLQLHHNTNPPLGLKKVQEQGSKRWQPHGLLAGTQANNFTGTKQKHFTLWQNIPHVAESCLQSHLYPPEESICYVQIPNFNHC